MSALFQGPKEERLGQRKSARPASDWFRTPEKLSCIKNPLTSSRKHNEPVDWISPRQDLIKNKLPQRNQLGLWLVISSSSILFSTSFPMGIFQIILQAARWAQYFSSGKSRNNKRWHHHPSYSADCTHHTRHIKWITDLQGLLPYCFPTRAIPSIESYRN